jgi:type II secretory pathway pseudopilin PulG
MNRRTTILSRSARFMPDSWRSLGCTSLDASQQKKVVAVPNGRESAGFTVVEMLVAIILTALLSAVVIDFAFAYWHFAYRQEADQEAMVDRLNASDYLREMLGTSSGLITQNGIADPNANVPDPGQPSGQYWAVLHAVPGLKSNSAGDTPLLYFRRFSFDSNNNVIMNGINPYEDEYVLYSNGPSKELRVRSLANTAATGNRLKTSCPPALASAICPADKVLLHNITGVDLQYYSRAGNTIDYTSSTDPLTGDYNGPDFSVVEVAQLTLNLAKKPLFQSTNTTQSATIIRIALRNT